MASVYDLGQGFDTLWALLEDELADDEVIADAFENLTEDLKDKFENCCKYIKNEEAVIAGLKAEEDRLRAKRKAKENARDRLKDLMRVTMQKAGEKKLPCGTFSVSLQNNPPSLVVDVSVADIPTDYLIPQPPKVDTDKLKKALKDGNEAVGAIAHLTQTEGLRIR